MQYSYPKPQDVNIRIPGHVIKGQFNAGFQHALQGGQLNKIEQLRLSFREGYRAGKLYLREVRRSRGILTFPVQGKLKIKTAV
jgi:hypothetical protein